MSNEFKKQNDAVNDTEVSDVEVNNVEVNEEEMIKNEDALEDSVVEDENDKENPKRKKKINLKLIIALVVVGTLIVVGALFGGKKKDLEIDIVDMNSSISEKVDKMIEKDGEKAGVHTVKDGSYTYVLIVSDKLRATEMSINLYDLYQKGFSAVLEYEVEVNEDTISNENPEKIQKMLVRFKGSSKVRPVITDREF